MEDKISYFETVIDDLKDYIQMYRDGEYDDDDDFLTDIANNAQCIHDEAMRD